MMVMNSIQATLIAATLVAGLAGCSTPPGSAGTYSAPVDAAEGKRCGKKVTGGPVFISVAYRADGMPIDPGECAVKSGTDVTWRGPDGEPVIFEIYFKETAPLESGERGPLSSVKADGRHKVKRKIGGPKGRYAYGIKANGKELDPVIIIE